MPTIDRDQTPAQMAYNSYNRLLKQFPSNKYIHTAQANMKKCLQSLAGHELYVAEFYLKSKKYKAALKRLNDLLNQFPDVGVQHKALQHVAMCEQLMNQSDVVSPEEEKKSRFRFWPF
jgi:outer membrane protein assembly factor BamD